MTTPPHPSVTPKETLMLQTNPRGDISCGFFSGDSGLQDGFPRSKKASSYAWLS